MGAVSGGDGWGRERWCHLVRPFGGLARKGITETLDLSLPLPADAVVCRLMRANAAFLFGC